MILSPFQVPTITACDDTVILAQNQKEIKAPVSASLMRAVSVIPDANKKAGS